MAFLKHLYNGSIVSVYELGDSTIIGRQVDCNIRVEDATVSGQHVRIEKKPADKTNKSPECWRLIDLGSTNGVFVNGKNVGEFELQAGTEFTLGTHAFEFHIEMPSQLDQTLKIKKSWIPGIYYTE
jgi:pSer/pThr/pTyr-binding forkhead associated (FHA) protein